MENEWKHASASQVTAQTPGILNEPPLTQRNPCKKGLISAQTFK